MRDRLAGLWTWLFPASYALHLGEEYRAGETFPGWVSRVATVEFSHREFVTINAVAFTLMVLAILAARRFERLRWLVVTLGFIVAFNGTAHAIASLLTWSCSPGVVSGVLVWVPLGVLALHRARPVVSRAEWRLGIASGIAAHALVAWLAFGG